MIQLDTFCYGMFDCSEMFSLVEGENMDRIIDMNASFSPDGFPAQLFKSFGIFLILAAIGLQVIYSGVYGFFFAFLSSWALIWALVYFVLSAISAAKSYKRTTSYPPTFIRITWVLFQVAAHSSLLTSVLYWAEELTSAGPVTFDVPDGFNHVVLAAVLVDGLVVNRIPVRFGHFVFCFSFDLFYLCWTVLHGQLGLGNPVTDDDLLYQHYDWQSDPEVAIRVSVVTLFGISPLLFAVLWLLAPVRFRRYEEAGSLPVHAPQTLYQRMRTRTKRLK